MLGKKGHVVHTNITQQTEEATDRKQKFPHRRGQKRKNTKLKLPSIRCSLSFI